MINFKEMTNCFSNIFFILFLFLFIYFIYLFIYFYFYLFIYFFFGGGGVGLGGGGFLFSCLSLGCVNCIRKSQWVLNKQQVNS